MFVPPFPIMVLAVFLGMRHVSAVVSGWGRGMFAVTFVVGCWASWLLLLVLLFTRLLIILAVISPPLGVRWIPSPLMISWTSSSLSLFEISVVFLSLARV